MAATQFEIDNALMAGAAYRSTRSSINRFPLPAGWSQIPLSHATLPSGFEAISFQRESNPNEIVISYAGTGPGGLKPGTPGFVDWIANSGLATGFGSDQLRQAALYYLEVKAANPAAIISFTGHSLGGGLAALMGVFFNKQAVTFDQAPFAGSATLSIREDLIDYLKANGYTDATLGALVPELLSFNPYWGIKGTQPFCVSLLPCPRLSRTAFAGIPHHVTQCGSRRENQRDRARITLAWPAPQVASQTMRHLQPGEKETPALGKLRNGVANGRPPLANEQGAAGIIRPFFISG